MENHKYSWAHARSLQISRSKAFKLFLLICLMVYGEVCAQSTLPSISTLPYSFNTYSGTSFPASLTIGRQSGTSVSTADITTDAPNGSSDANWRAEGASGISYKGNYALFGTNYARASFQVRVNTTALTNIRVTWTARTITDENLASSKLDLQWRNGSSGAWQTLSGTTYTSAAAGNAVTFSLILPAAANNLSDLRIRWFYYDDVNIFSSRDRVAVDDIFVCSAPSATASNNGPVCKGAALNFTSGPSGMTTYQWAGPNSFSNSTQNPSISSATGAATGTYTVTVTNSVGCSNSATTAAIVNDPTSTAGNNSPICAGSTLNLTATAVTGASYQWSGPNSFSSASQNPSISNATIAHTGTYTLTVTIGGCSSTTTTNVVVNPIPTITAGSNTPLCEGSALNLIAIGSAGSFVWSGPSGFASTSQNPIVTNVSISNSGTYTVTVTSSGCTVSSSTSVTVNKAPVGTPTSNPATVCAGANVNLFANMYLNNTYSASPNAVITDNNATGINSVIVIPSDVIASASRLKIKITLGTGHTYVGDLIAKITSPCGNTTVFDRPGVPATSTGNGQDFSGTYTFDVNASAVLPETNSGPTVITPGSYRPSLTNGTANTNWSGLTFPCNTAGNWTLNMSDRASGDVGTLVSWSVEIATTNGVTFSWSSMPTGYSSSLENPTAQPNITTQYIVSATGVGCTNSQAVNVSVNAAPDPAIGSNSPICEGNDIYFTGDNNAPGQTTGNTYSWKNPSNVVFSTQQNPSISFGTASNNGVYTVTITNQFLCTASATTSIIVNPNPTVAISNIVNESCPGAADGSFLAIGSNGTDPYNYTIDAFTTLNNDGIFSSLSPGGYNIDMQDNNGCFGSTTVTISSPNVAAAITCPGNQMGVAAAGLCSAVMSYSTSSTGIPSPAVSYIMTGATTGTGSGDGSGSSFNVGVTTVTVTSTNSCGTASCSFDVVVTDIQLPSISCPATGTVNVDFGMCTAASIGTPTVSDNCSVASLTPDNAGPYSEGTHTIVWTVTDVNGNINTCTQIVTVVDAENPVISGCPSNITVGNDAGTCGAVVNFTTPTASDNCSLSSLSANHSSGDVFPIGTTVVTYTATDAAGNVSTCSFNITVNGTSPIAPTSITSNASFNNICVGSSIQLNAIGGSTGNMNGNYMWYSGSCGGTFLGTGASISVSPNSNKTYFVRIEDGCGNTTSCISVNVIVSSSPVSSNVTVPFAGMPSNVCAGTVATLAIPSVFKATQYIWDAPSGSYFDGNPLNISPYTTSTPSVTITFGAPVGSLYNVGVQASNACGSSLRKIQKVRGFVSVPASISGPVTVCENSSHSYTTPDVDGATSYLWSVTGDATVTGNAQAATINFGPTWNGGTLCVAAQTNCYTSATKCIVLSKSAAAISNLSGSFVACPNTNQLFSVSSTQGVASYNWSLPPGTSGNSSTNNINVFFNSGYNSPANICVSVTSVCGITSAPKCKTVAPGLPSMPSAVSGPLTGLCGQTVVYQCPTQNGTTFNWSAPSGATINSGQGSNAVSVTYSSFSTSPLCVTASNACGNSAPRCVNVKGAPNSPQSIAATPGSWCANTSGVEFIADLGNLTGSYTLNWLYPSAPVATYVSGGGNSTNLVMDWGTGNGNVTVIANNACGNSSKVFMANVNCRESFNGDHQGMAVSPNPASTAMNINFTVETFGVYTLKLTDLGGRTVLSTTIDAAIGVNSKTVDLLQYAKGVYMLTLSGNEISETQRVVIE